MMNFFAYIGLEMAMSMIGFNDINEYWQEAVLCGNIKFKKIMSQDNFKKIHQNVIFYPPGTIDNEKSLRIYCGIVNPF